MAREDQLTLERLRARPWIAVVDEETFYLPHLLARLAQGGRLERIVVRRRGRTPAERWRSACAARGAWGPVFLAAAGGARVAATALDLACPTRFYSVAKVARRFGLPLDVVPRMNGPELAEILGNGSPVVFYHASARLTPATLSRGTFLNKHCGLLPSYAGAYPVFWAMLNGEHEIGVTIHVMDEEYDHGPVLAQVRIAAGGKTLCAAYHELHDRAVDLLLGALPAGGEPPASPPSRFGVPGPRDRRIFLAAGRRFGFPLRIHPAIE